MAVTRLPNEPVLPTATTPSVANPLRPGRRHIGQPLGGYGTT